MKDKFNQLITDTVKPLLKANGFSKKGLNFYRKREDLIFMFNFQNSQSNSFEQTKFYINCGIHSTAIDKAICRAERSEPKEYECYFRKRISSIVGSTNDGYFVTDATSLQILSSRIDIDLKNVLSLFDNIKSTNDLVDLMIETNGLDNYKELFEFLLLMDDRIRLYLFLKQLHDIFGTERRWSLLESNLTDILKDNNRKETITDILNEK